MHTPYQAMLDIAQCERITALPLSSLTVNTHELAHVYTFATHTLAFVQVSSADTVARAVHDPIYGSVRAERRVG